MHTAVSASRASLGQRASRCARTGAMVMASASMALVNVLMASRATSADGCAAAHAQRVGKGGEAVAAFGRSCGRRGSAR